MISDAISTEDSLIKDQSRAIYTEEAFKKLYLRPKQSTSVSCRQKALLFLCKNLQKIRFSCCGPTTNDSFGNLILRFSYCIFPFIKILRDYNVKNWLANDLITGFTIGVMHVPQGMAYAMLATLPPVYGLYCSMCASFFYFLFGTSRNLSLGKWALSPSSSIPPNKYFYPLIGFSGTVSVISLLVGGCLDRKIPLLLPNALANESTLMKSDAPVNDESEIANRVLLASALAMTVGIIQVIMSLLRLGFLTRLLSDPMLAGFVVGASIHVGISQVFVVFGLSLKKHIGIFNVPLNFYQICANLPNANWVTFGVSAVCIILLYVFQLWINPPVRRRVKVPVPIELLVIIFGGVASFCLKMKDNYNVKVVGTVPTGFPTPEVPRLSLAGEVLGDALVIALIVFSVAYSLASFYGSKEGYKVDPNQELLAYGVTNAAGSFFTAFPVGCAISRTALLNTMGAKSPIVGIIASVIVLIVTLFAGPLFYHVPNCCLSAIILVALRGVIPQLRELPVLWKYSIWDFASWVVAFLATVLLDVIYGLIIGVAFSALVVFFRSQFSKAFTIAHVEDTEVFRSNEVYNISVKDSKIKVIRYEGALFYAGADLFVSSVIEASGFDPRPVAFARKKLDAVVKEADVVLDLKRSGGRSDEIGLPSQFKEEVIKDGIMNIEIPENGSGRCQKLCPSKFNKCNISRSEAADKKKKALDQLSDLLSTVPLTHIILDCSVWIFIDIVGANALQNLLSDLNSAGVIVYLASLPREAYKLLLRSGLFEKFGHSIVFISVFDAYIAAQQHQQQPNKHSEEV